MKSQNRNIVIAAVVIIGLVILYQAGYLKQLGLFSISSSDYPAGVTLPTEYKIAAKSGPISYGWADCSPSNTKGYCHAIIYSNDGIVAGLDISNLFQSPNKFVNGYFVGNVLVNQKKPNPFGSINPTTTYLMKNVNNFNDICSNYGCAGNAQGASGNNAYILVSTQYNYYYSGGGFRTEQRILARPGELFNWCPSWTDFSNYAPVGITPSYVQMTYGWKAGCGFNYPVVQCYDNTDCSSYGTGYACDKTGNWSTWVCVPPLKLNCTTEGNIISYLGTSYTCYNGTYVNTQDLLNKYKSGAPASVADIWNKLSQIWSSFITWLNGGFS